VSHKRFVILLITIFVLTVNVSYASKGKVGSMAQLDSDSVTIKSDRPIKYVHVVFKVTGDESDSDIISFIEALRIQIHKKGFKVSSDPKKSDLILSLEIEKVSRNYWIGLPLQFGRQRQIACISVKTTYETSGGQWNKEFLAHKGYWTFKGDSYYRDATSYDLSRAIINPLHNYPKEKAFISAAGNGNIRAVYKYIGENINIDADNDLRYTALIAASENNHSDIVQLLISLNADLDARNEEGWSSLTYSSFNGDHDITLMLLSAGAYVNTEDDDKRTPLDWAVLGGHTDIAMLLLTHGSEIGNALDFAKKKGNKELEELLSSFAPTGNASSDYDCKYLTGLIKNGNKGKIQYLMKNNLLILSPDDPTCKDAMITAVKKGNTMVIDNFLDQGFDVNATNESGEVPLIEAAGKGRRDVVEKLIKEGADLNDFGSSALAYAAMNGQMEIVEYLLSERVDINALGKSGQTAGKTPLGEAARAGQKNTTELLLVRGAGINSKNVNGKTALMTAALNGHTEIVDLLLSHGADVNQEDKGGYTVSDLVAKARVRFNTIDFRDVVDSLKREVRKKRVRGRTLKSSERVSF